MAALRSKGRGGAQHWVEGSGVQPTRLRWEQWELGGVVWSGAGGGGRQKGRSDNQRVRGVSSRGSDGKQIKLSLKHRYLKNIINRWKLFLPTPANPQLPKRTDRAKDYTKKSPKSIEHQQHERNLIHIPTGAKVKNINKRRTLTNKTEKQPLSQNKTIEQEANPPLNGLNPMIKKDISTRS